MPRKFSKSNPPAGSIGWKFWTILGAFVIVTGLLTAPMFIKRRGGCGMTEKVSNLRQIGLALFEFETEYGTYPSEATAKQVTANHPGHGFDLSGDSSNALFRHLLAAGYTQSETMFYARVPGVRKPDGDISPGKALENGEVAFAYISVISTAGNPARPVALCPIIPGTTRFDTDAFEGNAYVLRADNTAATYKIKDDGHIYEKGINLLSPNNPIWGGKPFKIHYPELLPTGESNIYQKIFR